MADERNPALSRELLEVLAKHGVAGLPKETLGAPAARVPGGAAASYIKEIITSDQAFDERTLARVTKVLSNADRVGP